MALPCRQQRLLEAIDRQLADADPHLAWLLGAFGRLWADEPLPAREQLSTWASRLRSLLWEAFAAGAWPMPPLTDPPVTAAGGHPGAEHDSLPAPGGERQAAPDWPGRDGRHGRRPRGRG
ncbi:MAG TPA: hypothetical protein VFE59_34830 [Trebonia sp.]|jgi:hypothetical protein|nr:hypothetical protein [Trebonia sp.]